MSNIDGIYEDITTVIDKLDDLKAGQSIETAYIIERSEDVLYDWLRDNLDQIEKALNV